jgi:hypothetical protein
MRKTLVYPVAVLSLALGTAIAVDAPDVKEGLWSVHSQTTANPGNRKSEGATYTLCRDHAFDKATRDLAKSAKGCTLVSETFKDGKYSTKLHCVIGATTVDTQSTVTFESDTSTHTETHATYTPATNGVSETTLVQDQEYTGSCPAGAQPGDRTDEDGRVTHVGRRAPPGR